MARINSSGATQIFIHPEAANGPITDLTPYLMSTDEIRFEPTPEGNLTNADEIVLEARELPCQRNLFEAFTQFVVTSPPWNDPNSDPVKDIKAALERIREKHTWLDRR
jgi:hypothetical protein